MISGDTIVAPATPFGYAGLAIIRISGPETESMLKKVLRCAELPPVQHASLNPLYDSGGIRFEDAVVTRYRKPHSYTGEDLAEISVHGNPLIVQKVLDVLCDTGCRLADPGEFTQRAFLNSRLDLVQVESVAALVHSRSNAALRLNYRHLRGDLSAEFNKIRNNLIDLSGRVEWWLDISEDELEDAGLESFLDSTVKSLLSSVSSLIKSYSSGRRINKGYSVVIVGKPNVGKSTLLNALTNTDRAITSHIPGTTRDTIDFFFTIDGVPVTLIDTAGIRKTGDHVETIGVERALEQVRKADLILNVRDFHSEFVELTDIENIPVIRVHNKIDNRKSFSRKKGILFISSLQGEGVDTIKDQIKTKLGISGSEEDSLSITTARQHRALVHCQKALFNMSGLLDKKPRELELVSVELLDAIGAIDTILGKTTPDDILNSIFSSFCVGK